MISLTQKQTNRFWGHVDKEKSNIFYNGSRCWEWIKSCDIYGYGWFRYKDKMKKVHRISYELSYGEIPEGLQILHHCDNPPCCNPEHLFSGTHQDNIDDKTRKGRQYYKISDAQVSEILKRYGRWGKNGETTQALAKEFGVSQALIWLIVKYKSRT